MHAHDIIPTDYIFNYTVASSLISTRFLKIFPLFIASNWIWQD